MTSPGGGDQVIDRGESLPVPWRMVPLICGAQIYCWMDLGIMPMSSSPHLDQLTYTFTIREPHLSSTTKHSGPIKSLQFNPFKSELLLTGGAKGEVGVNWSRYVGIAGL